MKDIGGGNHTVVVAGNVTGSHCVAIAIKRRWASHITDLRQSHRSLATTIQTTSEKMCQTGKLQALSLHAPSVVGRSPEEVTPAIMAWADPLAGGRRAASIAGMDSNLQISTPRLGHVGAALRDWRPVSSRTMTSRAPCAASPRHNLKALNT